MMAHVQATNAGPASEIETVLVVDDNPDNLLVLEKILMKEIPSVRVVKCSRPEEAVGIAAKEPIGAAMFDIQMPGIDGIELCRRLKAEPATMQIPVILLTSHRCPPAMKAEGLGAGAVDFLVRPIDNVELVARVRVVLQCARLCRYADIVTISRDMIALLNAECVYLAVNDAYLAAFGKSRREVVGHRVSEVFGSEFFEAAIRLNAERCMTGQEVRYEDWFDFPVAGRRLMEIVYSPYRGAGGVICGFAVNGRDVTERRELEDQLRQSQKLEAIGQLAGGVAHDFNNLLTVMLGRCEMMESKLPNEGPVADDLKEIQKCGERATTLTRQLLAFSRKQPLALQIIDVNQLLAGLGKLLRPIIGEGVELVSVLGSDTGRVMADPAQLEQVVMNLVINARDAMPAGGRLTIETANVEYNKEDDRMHVDKESGPHVMIAVSDTGHGMDEETTKKIFEPFFTTKERGKGTGLGLSTVYGIVRQSGGSISVRSKPGKGATFKVHLPRVEGEAATIIEKKEAKPRAAAGEHILIAEDDDAIRGFLEAALKGLGYRVTLAANGDEALLVVEEKGLRPDLLITDVVMPGMNGNMLAGRLRRTCPNLPVLYMSGYAAPAVDSGEMPDLAAPILQKPFNIASLAKRVRDLFDAD